MKFSLHKVFFLPLFFLFFNSTFSQNLPWNAKFILKHPNGLSDTVWFGCDTVATDGFDAGLDILDTSSFPPVAILSHELNIQQAYNTDHCGNLKKNIKPFKNGKVVFTFYPLSDTISYIDSINQDCMAGLHWDTSDFVFQNDSFKIISYQLKSYYGYIGSIDQTIFYVGFTDGPPICLIPESTWFSECNYSGYSIDSFYMMRIDLELFFNFWTGITESKYYNNFNFINPNNGIFEIDFKKIFNGNIQIFNSIGQMIFYKKMSDSIYEQIDLSFQPKGIYFLNIYNEIYSQTFKIIIQ